MSKDSPVIIPGRISGNRTNRRKQSLSRKLRPLQSKSRRHAERQRDDHRRKRDLQAVEHGIPDRPVREERAIPVKREMMRRESTYALAVEGIKNENGNRQIEEHEYGDGVEKQPA